MKRGFLCFILSAVFALTINAAVAFADESVGDFAVDEEDAISLCDDSDETDDELVDLASTYYEPRTQLNVDSKVVALGGTSDLHFLARSSELSNHFTVEIKRYGEVVFTTGRTFSGSGSSLLRFYIGWNTSGLDAGTYYCHTVTEYLDPYYGTWVVSYEETVEIELVYHNAFGGHVPSLVYSTDPTCSESGTQHYVCKVLGCGSSWTETIPPTGKHTLSSWSQTVEATCSQKGAEERHCINSTCTYEETRSLGYADHSYSDWRVTVEPTEKAMGREQRTCAVCEKTEVRALARIGGKLFSDVTDPGAWYFSNIYKASDMKLVSGYSDGRFEPTGLSTRAQVAVILWNAYGKPKTGSVNTTGMPDVKDNAYYTAAANWAVANGLINGKKSGDVVYFDPSGEITRQELFVMIVSTADKLNGVKTQKPDKSKLNGMSDVNQVSSWAINATAWCLNNGVISGKGGTKVAPKDNVTRAEICTIMINAIKNGFVG